MTKKDYKLIADALRAASEGLQYGSFPRGTPEWLLAQIVAKLSRALQGENPRFNPEKFKAAVYR